MSARGGGFWNTFFDVAENAVFLGGATRVYPDEV